MSGTVIWALTAHPKGGGTPVCKLYRYVPYQTVWVLSRVLIWKGGNILPIMDWNRVSYQGNHRNGVGAYKRNLQLVRVNGKQDKFFLVRAIQKLFV